jgi:hypothetical protein
MDLKKKRAVERIAFSARISTRTPKDLQKFSSKGRELDPKKMRVKDGESATNLITRSQDVHYDLVNHILFRDPMKSMYLILTEFVEIPPLSKFLCFMYQKNLVAISQSRHEYEKVHYTQKNKKEFQDILEDFISSIYRWLPYNNCILEVYLSPIKEEEEYYPKIIDIFPYERSSDIGLYNWTEDAAILFAEKPDTPDLRVNNTLLK